MRVSTLTLCPLPQVVELTGFKEACEWVVQSGQQLANGVVCFLPAVHGLILQELLSQLHPAQSKGGSVELQREGLGPTALSAAVQRVKKLQHKAKGLL